VTPMQSRLNNHTDLKVEVEECAKQLETYKLKNTGATIRDVQNHSQYLVL